MTTWTERAKRAIDISAQIADLPTAETDETRVLSVVSVASPAVSRKRACVSSVSSAALAPISESTALTTALVNAAMRSCDEWHDNPIAREEMRNECMSLPTELQADLLEHFDAQSRSTLRPASAPDSRT